MNDSRAKELDEISQILTAMQLLARRINAHFVVDPKRLEDFETAILNRRKRKESTQPTIVSEDRVEG